MIESIGYTPTRKRANRIQNSIEDVLTESMNRKVEEKDTFFLETSMNRDLSFNSARSINEAGKSIEHEKTVTNNIKLESYMLGEAFANIVYQAIPLDESYKETIKEEINEKASGLILGLQENGVLQEGNYVWNNYLEHINDVIPSLKENSNDLVKVESILTETEKEIKANGVAISSIIENKVLDVIVNERYIANKRESLMESNKKFNGKTLFNAMSINNLKAVSSSDKYIDLPQDKKLDISFAETIIDYTLLETLNTLNLVKFDVDAVTNAVKHI